MNFSNFEGKNTRCAGLSAYVNDDMGITIYYGLPGKPTFPRIASFHMSSPVVGVVFFIIAFV